jgi:hypothetical protein
VVLVVVVTAIQVQRVRVALEILLQHHPLKGIMAAAGLVVLISPAVVVVGLVKPDLLPLEVTGEMAALALHQLFPAHQ